MAEASPDPWRIEGETQAQRANVVDATGTLVADCNIFQLGRRLENNRQEINEANAQRIVAISDLERALIGLMRAGCFCDAVSPNSDDHEGECLDALKALTKAGVRLEELDG